MKKRREVRPCDYWYDTCGQVETHFVVPRALTDIEIKVLVGGNAEHVVGGQTLTLTAAEPSRTPHSFKVLWGAGQPEPQKWYPGAFFQCLIPPVLTFSIVSRCVE